MSLKDKQTADYHHRYNHQNNHSRPYQIMHKHIGYITMKKVTRRTAMATTTAGIIAAISTAPAIAQPQSQISKRIEAWKAARAEWNEAIAQEEPAEIASYNNLESKLPDWRNRTESEIQHVRNASPEYAKYKAINKIQIEANSKDADAINAILACPVFLLQDIKTKAQWIKQQYAKGGCIEDGEDWVAEALIKSFTDIV